MLITNSLTASTLNFSTPSDSVKCFSIDEAKMLLLYANRGLKLDTITALYEQEIKTLDAIIEEKDKQLLLSEGLIRTQSNQIEKYKRREKWFIVGISASTLAALFIAIFK